MFWGINMIRTNAAYRLWLLKHKSCHTGSSASQANESSAVAGQCAALWPSPMAILIALFQHPAGIHCLPVHLINVIVGSAVGDVLGIGSLHRERRWSLDSGLRCSIYGEVD